MDIAKLAERFLGWPLPESVCSDLCATKQGYPHRSGTNLLSYVEAKQMFEYVLAELAAEQDKALADARRAALEDVKDYVERHYNSDADFTADEMLKDLAQWLRQLASEGM